jgi:UDP-N-acetylglucosamine 2-epimerase (non-hydrolysing)
VKIMTILGTRPEIIRLSLVIPKLDRACNHVLVHTGQNYDPALTDVFFAELGLRAPNHALEVRGATFGEQAGAILAAGERVLRAERPERLLLLGDTNSSLVALVAKRMGIPVYHMEAGNRCYDDRVPEEVNRRVIDHCSDVLLPYTERSRANLLREGIPGDRVFVTGNPILEVIRHYDPAIGASTALRELGLEPEGYFLVTMHRAENVDVESRLAALAAALRRLHGEHRLPVIVSMHPRTRERMRAFGIPADGEGVRFLPPFGFPAFIALERAARCVLSDSGTVQEECALLRRPNVTLRDVTERPETIECGSNVLAGADPDTILACVRTALARRPVWTPPREYLVEDVSDTVVGILLGHRHVGG